MESTVCIRLPFLRAREETSTGCLYLWPGHGPAPANAWMPADYPLDAQTALAFMNALANISLPELETMRQSFSGGGIISEINIRSEMADLARFAGRKSDTGTSGLARLQAQKALLWRWLWEGSLEEIAALEAECNASEQNLPKFFQETSFVTKQTTDTPKTMQFNSWRSIAANALIFIPSEIPILAEGSMAGDLEEILEFEAATDDLRQAEAPLWLALGYSRPASGLAEKTYNQPRRWLTRRENSHAGRQAGRE